jgi:LacI family transcriptional regulator
MRNHTLKSIAKIAGLSKSTVSRVINRQKYVKPQIREKILDIIRRENYYPHAPARSLVSQRTNTAGIVVFGLDPLFLSNQVYYEIIQGIQKKALESDIDLILYSPDKMAKDLCYKIIGRRNVDGLIVMGELIHVDYLRLFYESQLPVVLIGKRDTQELKFPYVCTDYRSGAYLGTKYLLNLGRRHILMMQCFRHLLHEKEKFRGYKKALDEDGITLCPEIVVEGQAVPEKARIVIREALRMHPEVEGIFAANDLMAQGCIQEIQSLGLAVPEDISVIGFDDIITSKSFSPPLTTIRQDKLRLGAEALEVLLELLASKKAKPRVLPAELVIRETASPLSKFLEPPSLRGRPTTKFKSPGHGAKNRKKDEDRGRQL